MAARRTPLTFDANGVTAPVIADAMPWNSVYLKGTGAIAAGVVTLETCDALVNSPPENPTAGVGYGAPTGTSGWASAGVTVNASGAASGGQAFGQWPVGAYSLIRLRITTPLTAGTSLTAVVVQTGTG